MMFILKHITQGFTLIDTIIVLKYKLPRRAVMRVKRRKQAIDEHPLNLGQLGGP